MQLPQVDPEAEDESSSSVRRLHEPPDSLRVPVGERLECDQPAWALLPCIPGPSVLRSGDRASPPRRGPGPLRASRPVQVAGPAPPHAPVRSSPSPPVRTPSRATWTSGRSSSGGGYDPRTMRAAEGSQRRARRRAIRRRRSWGFGRYSGWSLGEIAPAAISSTSSGSTGWRSAASTVMRSTPPAGEPAQAASPREAGPTRPFRRR